MTTLVLAALLLVAADGSPRVLATEPVDVLLTAESRVAWTDERGVPRDVRAPVTLRLEAGEHRFESRSLVLVERADGLEAVALAGTRDTPHPAPITALAVTLAVILGRCSITFKRRQPKRRPAKPGVAEP